MADLPPEAEGRLERPAFSSGLTVPDFAACLHMGMRPVGLVQGFCVMQWSWYGGGSSYYRGGGGFGPVWYGQSRQATTIRTYRCPHNFVSAEHRSYGENFEQTWVEQAWADGFGAAHQRMVEEATLAGAHGIIGVVDTTSQLIDAAIREFHFLGTAVVVDGAPAPATPWTTYLAGQRLAKLVEAGYMPVSVVGAMASVRLWAVCVTETLLAGVPDYYGAAQPGDEIVQLADAQMEARRQARRNIRRLLGNDELHGATMTAVEAEIAAGDAMIDCTLKGTRVRRFKDVDPLPAPVPTVRLG